MKKETLQTAEALIMAGIHDATERAAVLARLEGKQPERRDKLLTAKEVAALAGIHKKTVEDWARKGYLHPKKITPKRVRYSRREVEEFLCETAAEG